MTPDSERSTKPRHPRTLRRQRAEGPIDGIPASRLEYDPPVADWLAFLAELLAAEFVRETTPGSDAT